MLYAVQAPSGWLMFRGEEIKSAMQVAALTDSILGDRLFGIAGLMRSPVEQVVLYVGEDGYRAFVEQRKSQ